MLGAVLVVAVVQKQMEQFEVKLAAAREERLAVRRKERMERRKAEAEAARKEEEARQGEQEGGRVHALWSHTCL